MSDFKKMTKHPESGEWADADWMDDHFGQGRYGVMFPDSDAVWNPDKHDLETRDYTAEERIPGLERDLKDSHERYWLLERQHNLLIETVTAFIKAGQTVDQLKRKITDLIGPDRLK